MKKVLDEAKKWIGYLEKKDANKNYLWTLKENAGWANFTCFWEELQKSLQGQPWCNAWLNYIYVKAHGTTTAKKLLCTDGEWSFYTPTSASYFKKKGRWHSEPKQGDVVFFHNTERICHIGIVEEVNGDTIQTIEGNTSSVDDGEVYPNGGGVFRKTYKWKNNSRIAGYGRPDYNLVDADKYQVGWNSEAPDETGRTPWWYADTSKTYVKDAWKVINGCKYYFNHDGYAVYGFQVIDGERYFFEDTIGSAKECALMTTDENGAFRLWREEH